MAEEKEWKKRMGKLEVRELALEQSKERSNYNE
jgi:hypothetical protein